MFLSPLGMSAYRPIKHAYLFVHIVNGNSTIHDLRFLLPPNRLRLEKVDSGKIFNGVDGDRITTNLLIRRAIRQDESETLDARWPQVNDHLVIQ